MPDDIIPADSGYRGRALVRITPGDVGRRVSLRRVVGTTGGRPLYGDVLGHLVSWVDGTLVVRRGDAGLVEVSEPTLVAARVVPEPARRRGAREAAAGARRREVTAAELAEVAARSWPALEQAWLGRWWLRAAGGFTGRANAVVPLGDPGLPLDAALARVAGWYAVRGLPPWFMVEVGSALDAELAARDWRPTHGGAVLVQTAPIGRVLRAAAPARTPEPMIDLAFAPPEGWLWLYRGEGELPAVAGHVLGAHPRVAFVTVGQPVVAGGRVTVDGRWAGVAGMVVADSRRRRGLGRLVLRRLLEWARGEGATEVFLQVSQDNAPAVALYAAAGFTTHHRYHYLAPPAP